MPRIFLLMLCSTVAHAALYGVLTDASTGEPIPEVRIMLFTGHAEIAGEAMSDAQGRYRIAASRGDYRVLPSKRGYREIHLMNEMNTGGLPISLGDADSVLDFELVKFCQVSGRITDTSGNPVNAVQVVTITQGAPDQVVRLASRWRIGQPTGDGRYFLGSGVLFPGRYLIAVVPATVRPGESVGQAFPPIYYPGVDDPEKAQPIILKPGESREIDFVLPPPSGHPVDGVVSGIPSGWAKNSIAVSLASAAGALLRQTTMTDADGGFHFNSVPSGSYTLLAAGPYSPSGSLLSTAQGRYHGRQALKVSDSDVADAAVALYPTATLRGRLVFANGEKPDASCFPAGVGIQPLDPVLEVSAFGSPLSELDGTFVVEHVPYGRYRISPRVGCAASSPEQTIFVNAPEMTVSPVITAKVASVGGAAPAKSFVVLAPEFSSGDFDFTRVKTTRADAQGSYHFRSVGFGRYRLMALGSPATHNYLETLFWRDHQSQTAVVELSAGAAVRANLKLLEPKEEWQ